MTAAEADDVAAEQYEEKHVHGVYEEIASHFSSTRYKPWPIVESFIRSLDPGAVGIDAGCGNGKYLGLRQDIFILASDRSRNLVAIARAHEPHTALIADSLALPLQEARFDFAISIAVIHHFSTRQRRSLALKLILDCLKDGGKALIYVWALEQKGSRRGWDEGGEQDVMVPWIMKSQKKRPEDGQEDKKLLRFYHLYRKGELEEDVISAHGKVLECGYERDNWWVICQRA
ncbi:hypothetical protein K3495_g725 [Podosphaera aphanis]|nr:hypothetical protein K3495_g725 [Podosphaera aphanis]